jgi:hypothetical protein
MILSRRSLLRGLVAAPAVVAIGSIMPVRLWQPERGLLMGDAWTACFLARIKADFEFALSHQLVTRL